MSALAKDDHVGLIGQQTAPTRILQPGLVDHSGITLAEAIGINLLPWQKEVLSNMTAQHVDQDRWAAREILLLQPRQNGKSMILMLRILVGALVLGDKDILYSAHDYRTSVDFWLMMLRTLEDHPMLRKRVVKTRKSAAEHSVTFDNGAVVKMISRTANAGRGLHPDLIIFDEAFSVAPEVVAAIMPAQGARPNPQAIWASSAGMHNSHELLKIRKRLHSGEDKWLTGWDWHAPLDHDIEDVNTWAIANPSLGAHLRIDELARENMTQPNAAFRREHLGQWADIIENKVFESAEISKITIDPLPAPDDHSGVGLSFGVEIVQQGALRSSSSVVACWQPHDSDTKIMSVIKAGPGVEWLPEFLVYLDTQYAGCPIAYDAKSPARDLFERAEADGVELIPIVWSEYTKACSMITQCIKEGMINICRMPTNLIMEMGIAKEKATGASWVWDRAVLNPPASLIAATAALWAHDHVDHGGPEIY